MKTLKSKGYGCLGDTNAGCLLLADNILLLSASIIDLQYMLNVCCSYCDYWDLKFRCNKIRCNNGW